ncbi:hypothetical protein GUITHDRAFT_116790 [Guillardia theta CCMP2712]|uniref:Protein kinase domain-containing protein n=1 Tax=Guillardia theta (strain CCMP2712) TaxID=905079 RepID=L1IMM8_GUITC|nr:hypothetical protein GUITHDRAFT_116790 [Guillardia theta CCMP2712]EKX37065.1 hypothetical protein GUITHDRAFT_116790 [Guillardia theta CCMP2712]|eukprot:XP_005824045.1 hypothetical protein GUITHDRAFT_116790 [Guillardia theta CCMP2712]
MCPLSPDKAPLTPGGGRGSGGYLSDESFMSTEPTGTTGTYRYMAPEIFRGEGQYTAAVDVYSFSLVMWYIFAGEHPLEIYFCCGSFYAQGDYRLRAVELVEEIEAFSAGSARWIRH